MVKKIVTDADILRAARQRIATYKSDAVCFAIDNVKIGTIEQKTALKRWIMDDLLDGLSIYTRWVHHTHPKRYLEMLKVRGSFRKARLAWIDWMISEKEKAHG